MAVDTTFNAPTWNFIEIPTGSATATLESMDMGETTKVISLIADVEGTYIVEFTDGGLGDTVVINAANYMGMPETGLSCGSCHGETQDKWEETGAIERFIWKKCQCKSS